MLALTIVLGLIMLLVAAGLGGFYALAKHPPVIHVDLGEIQFGSIRAEIVGTFDATQMVPSNLTLWQGVRQPESATEALVALPLDILLYCEQESEEHARTLRKKHARTLFAELGDWPAVLQALKHEDGLVDDQPDATRPEETTSA